MHARCVLGRVLRLCFLVHELLVLWVVRLRFGLKNRCVQSLAEVPPIFGMVTLAGTRGGSLVRTRRSIKETELGRLKI